MIAARFSTSVLDHSANARLAAARRHSPPISISGTLFLLSDECGSQISLAELLVMGGGRLGPGERCAGQLLLQGTGGNAGGEDAGANLAALGHDRAGGDHRSL